jgi:CRISPR-associated protein Csd1
MTILQSLVAFYDRLDARGDVATVGYAPVRIGFILEISADGEPRELIDVRDHSGKKPVARKLIVPAVSRTSGIEPAFLWDKTAYVFGVIAVEEPSADRRTIVAGQGKRTLQEHAAFVAAHVEALANTTDTGLIALLGFLHRWTPDQWVVRGFTNEALDQNIAFRLRDDDQRLDERAAAREFIGAQDVPGTATAICLINGVEAPFATKQPQFKGVLGAQSSGAPIVSFNSDAFESYGKDKGANAPVSEDAAFRYGAALNWLLDRDNSRVLRIGETTVVFWADEKVVGEPAAEAVEDEFWAGFGDAPPPDIDKEQAGAISTEVQNIRTQRRAPDASALRPETRMHILGLSPNSGRIAVRFWLVDTFGDLSRNLQRHLDDLAMDPPAFKSPPKAWALLYETAAQRKAENIPPRLGGELAQAILTGGRYPRTLLSTVVGRIRADKNINGPRMALCKAVINRDLRKNGIDETTEGLPVALNEQSQDEAYNLGRLFAVYEYAELSVAKRNASIRDKYIGAASATPRRVFPILMRGYEHNASGLAKGEGNQRGAGVRAKIAVSQILGLFDGELAFPTALRLDDQARFFVGYYHQNKALYTKSERTEANTDTADAEGAAP